jgi:RHS repeat-associated protein
LVTSLTNGAGALAQTYTFDSFGKQIASNGSLTNPFQYTAREFDTETGLCYYRARYYDPATGRFISEDPVTFTGGIDFYPYVENNPIEFRDVFGLQALRKPNPTPLPEPPAPGPILVPDAPPLTFWDVFFDWLGDALGAGGLILANPTDLNPNEPDPSQFPNPRKIQQPECPKRGCTCTCRADADASMPGNIRPGKPLFAFGTATEKNCGDAKRAAEKIAKHALGMKTKHVQCKCAGR